MDGYKKTVYCYDCGKDITNDYKIGTDNGMICIDCLHNDTVHKGKSYVSLLESTSNLTITGIILAVILIMVANVPAVSQTTEEVSWIIAMISSVGFFFGVKTVVRWISKWPMPLVISSIVLCILFLGILLQITAWIGWITMIRDWCKVKQMEKEYRSLMDFMDKVLSDIRQQTYKKLESNLKKWN